MAKEDVVFLIDAKDHASPKLDNVKAKSGGLQKSAITLAQVTRGLNLNIPGLDAITDNLSSLKNALNQTSQAAATGAPGLGIYKLALLGVITVVAEKAIFTLLGGAKAQKDLNEAIARGNELNRQAIDVMNRRFAGEQFEISLLKDPEEQKAKLRDLIATTTGELAGAQKSARQTKEEFDKAWRFESGTSLFGSQTEEQAAKAAAGVDGANEKAKELDATLKDLNTQLYQLERREQEAAAAKLAAHFEKVRDAGNKWYSDMRLLRDTIGLTDRDTAKFKMTLDGLDKPASDAALAMYDQAQAIKAAGEAAKQTETANRSLIEGLQKELDLLELGADAARLKEAANQGASQEALKEAKALQDQIAALKEKEKVESDLSAIKKRNEDEIGRLEEQLKEEASRGRGPIPILVAQESRLLTRGTGKDPASSTAENTKKMKEEIEKLRAEQRIAEEAAAKLMAEIAKNSKPVPDKVLT